MITAILALSAFRRVAEALIDSIGPMRLMALSFLVGKALRGPRLPA